MGGALKRTEICTKFRQGKPERKDNLEDLVLDGRISIEIYFILVVFKGAEYIHLGQNRGPLHVPENTVIIIRVP